MIGTYTSKVNVMNDKKLILSEPKVSGSLYIRCGGDEKTEWPRRTDKSRTLKNTHKKNQQLYIKI